MRKRPENHEYNAYFSTYVSLVPEGDLLEILNEQVKETVALLQDISNKEAEFRYAPGKWSVKEVLGHMADTERIMSYRLLSIARGETKSLPGFNQQIYVQKASFDRLSVQDLLENLQIVRQSTLQLLKSLDDEAWLRSGIANDSNTTVRAIAYIIAGHELHHRQIIKERYLPELG